jgi:hypothetical protein
METRRIVIDYAPRRVFMPFHNRTQRFAIGVAHRRAGKTVGTINDLIKRTITNPRDNPRAAYIAPLFNQAKDVAWAYLKRYADPLLAKAPNESELYVELLNGGRIRLYGADNPDRLRGIYLDDVVLDEYADMHPAVWGGVIRPLLSDRQGGASFIGTPKGRNAFYDLFARAEGDPDWFQFMLRASETGIIQQSELDAARKDMTPEQYEQEFECSFDAAIMGAYFGKEVAEAEREGRITDVPYEPDLPLYTAWDLGVGDSTAIWFWQAVRGEIRVIDYYENNGQQVSHYIQELNSRPYVYEADYVPHDARVREFTGDDRTRIESMVAKGRNPRLVPNHKIMDGINAARVLFGRMVFDAAKCRDGLEALRQYRADYDDKTRAFRDAPKHDWTSHAADAFRYLAMAWRELAPEPPPKPEMRGLAEMTFDEINKLHDRRREDAW